MLLSAGDQLTLWGQPKPPRRRKIFVVKRHRYKTGERIRYLSIPDVWNSVCALGAAADFTGAPAFALSLPHLPFLVSHAPPGAPAGNAPVQVFSGRSLRQRTLWVSVVIANCCGSVVGQGGCGGGVRGHGAGARAHGFGDNFKLVGARTVVLLLVLYAAVVLEEELAGLLQHPAALADGTVGQRAGGYDGMQHKHSGSQSGRDSLLLASPVEEVSPFGAGLLAADPKNCRYSNNQSH